jgi:hypothetical protein
VVLILMAAATAAADDGRPNDSGADVALRTGFDALAQCQAGHSPGIPHANFASDCEVSPLPSVDSVPLKPRYVVRIVHFLWFSARARYAAFVLALMAFLRLLAIPPERWHAAGRSVRHGVQRTALATLLMCALGPAFGSFVLWLLVLLPFIAVCITIVVVMARHM